MCQRTRCVHRTDESPMVRRRAPTEWLKNAELASHDPPPGSDRPRYSKLSVRLLPPRDASRKVHGDQSARSATVGSTRAARSAGIVLAATATTNNRAPTAPRIHASCATARAQNLAPGLAGAAVVAVHA